MKDHAQIKLDMNDAAAASYERNRVCLEDYEFAVVPGAMWKDQEIPSGYGDRPNTNWYMQFRNKPKPEINKITGPINRILGQKERLEMNAIIAPNSDEATEDDAYLLQSRWRNDFQTSDGVEAINNADKEAFFGGFGAYKIVAKYQDEENPDQDKQNLCVVPIMSAPSCVLFGPSLRKDKADCTQAWELIRVNRKEIEEEFGKSVSSINMQMAWFDWDTDTQKDMYLAHYYEVVTKRITTYDFGGYKVTAGDGIKDEYGNKITRDELKDLREANEHEKTVRKVKQVEYALISGDGILKTSKTPFKRQPIIPQYGYYSVINGIEYYCGEVARRRDPQMFSNIYYSALMEVLAAPQVEKPEYAPDQIRKHPERKSADIDGAAFVMSDPLYNKDGSIAALGPIGKQTPPMIGTGMATAGQQLNADLAEMGASGNSTVPSNAAAEAIQQVNERQDDTFQPLMQNSMAANRAACECWIDGAQKLYFSNSRNIRVLAENGEYSNVETLQYAEDSKGNYGPYGNSARGKYTVQVKLGEGNKSKKEAELETTLKMLNYADTNTPQGQLLLNQAIISTTGEGGARSRKVANYQIIDNLLALGLDPEADTEEEKEYVAQKLQQMQAAQQNQQPDPASLLAQAEMMKAQADMLAQQNKQTELNIQMLRIQGELEGKQEKLDSDLAVSAAKIDQDQQKIDNDARNNATKNAIEIAKLEQQARRDLSQDISSNVRQIR